MTRHLLVDIAHELGVMLAERDVLWRIRAQQGEPEFGIIDAEVVRDVEAPSE